MLNLTITAKLTDKQSQEIEMANNSSHPYASFASRYADPTQSYLTAYTALERANSLVEDAKRVKEAMNNEQSPEDRWMPWFGAEIVSYYAVGYVTCLEWHARSRVVDLLTFDPSVRFDEFRGQISDKLIVEMLGQKASVSHLVGASINVPGFDRYLSIMARILGHFGIRNSIGDWLTGDADTAAACWIKPSNMLDLEHLFTFRNSLVHEIGSNVMGHFNIRDNWDFDEAIRSGTMVASVIQGIESVFTRVLPNGFPNKLNEGFYPVDPLQSLREVLVELETMVDRHIRGTDWQSPHTIKLWDTAQSAVQVYMIAQEKFIEGAEMLHWRYLDARFPLRLNSLNARIEFLRGLLDNFDLAHFDGESKDPQATDFS
jgi:hypothetical protein